MVAIVKLFSLQFDLTHQAFPVILYSESGIVMSDAVVRSERSRFYRKYGLVVGGV
jgi:hypothetical protein